MLKEARGNTREGTRSSSELESPKSQSKLKMKDRENPNHAYAGLWVRSFGLVRL